MRQLKYLMLALMFLSLQCYKGKAQELGVNIEAQQLNDSTVNLAALGEEAKMLRAIDLLDKAIALSPDYYSAH